MVKKKIIPKLIPSIVFVFSSIVLFVNNLTGFFQIYSIGVNLNVISWFAIVLSIVWWMFLFGKENRMW